MMPYTGEQSFEDAFVAALRDATAPGPAGLAHQAAFAVYRNTVTKGSIDALQANYPAVSRLMGDTWFRAIARDYVLAHPPRSPLLVAYGEGFHDYLRDLDAVREFPYLPAVATLDRDWTMCHIAPDAPVLPRDVLTGMTPDSIAASVLSPHPAARWQYFEDCPAHSIWARNRDHDANDGELDWRPEGSLLTRPQGAVQWTAIDPAAWVLLERCAAGETLGVAADHCLTRHPEADLIRIIATLIEQGAFTSISATPTNGDPSCKP